MNQQIHSDITPMFRFTILNHNSIDIFWNHKSNKYYLINKRKIDVENNFIAVSRFNSSYKIYFTE